jgi:hypothetical protein
MKSITLTRLKHHTFKNQFQILFDLLTKLHNEEELSVEERKKILSISILFSNQNDEQINRLGYRIALLYSLKHKDYLPLYDTALNTGIMPIIALLNNANVMPRHTSSSSSFIQTMNESVVDGYTYGGLVRTEQQIYLNKTFEASKETSLTVIAPTSYGKSELIVQAIESFNGKNLCILVPSKSLLTQTKKRIFDGCSIERIISHPEMYTEINEKQIFVLTQERCTRLLNKHPDLNFDLIFVDEAHNILDGDNRSILLTSVIKIIEKRNPNAAFKFLTPFLHDSESLNIKSSNIKAKNLKVTEYVKSELIYLADFRKNTELSNKYKFYDQFFDEFTDLKHSEYDSHIDYVISNSLSKNVLYFNKPKNIQSFASELSDHLTEINNDTIKSAILEISKYTHKEYLLIKCLKKGVLYHHGSMADSLRHFVEYIYRTCKDVRYLICSSTLLEGVNLPVERIFLMDYKKGKRKLSPSQFKNLIGRVNRFSEIFSDASEESISRLTPQVHIVSSKYTSPTANLEDFIIDSMNVTRKETDKLENIMLQGVELKNKSDIDSYNSIKTRLENIEPGIFADQKIQKVKTKVGVKLLESNINEIDIFMHEETMQQEISNYLKLNKKISDTNNLLSVISNLFISRVKAEDKYSNLLRINNLQAQTFYAMFLDWKIENITLGIMISRFVKYWDNQPADNLTFVGSWGDRVKDDGHQELYTHMKSKSFADKINLAIVRIKEEEDFVDYIIFRFIDILYDLELIDDNFYKLIKYGTADQKLINMIQNGFSKSVASLILNEYFDYVRINNLGEYVVSSNIYPEMLSRKEGFFVRDEISQNMKTAN